MRQFFGLSLFVMMTLSGFIDTYRMVLPRLNRYQMYTEEELYLADWVKKHTDPDSIWLTAPYHNHWLYNLTGRQPVMAYEGWLWTHGYSYGDTKEDLERMFREPGNKQLYEKYHLDYVAVGPIEMRDYKLDHLRFQQQFQVVKKTENYVIYWTGRNPLKDYVFPPSSEETRLIAERTLGEDRYMVPGLVERIYRGMYWYGKPQSVKKGSFDFDFSFESNQPKPFPTPCSIEWEGFLRIAEPGLTSFILESDDGSWLAIDKAEIMDNGGKHELRRLVRKVNLSKGFHTFKLRYFDEGGGAIFHLKWIPPGGTEQPLGRDFLFYEK